MVSHTKNIFRFYISFFWKNLNLLSHLIRHLVFIFLLCCSTKMSPVCNTTYRKLIEKLYIKHCLVNSDFAIFLLLQTIKSFAMFKRHEAIDWFVLISANGWNAIPKTNTRFKLFSLFFSTEIFSKFWKIYPIDEGKRLILNNYQLAYG